jgi:hypothetical protein
MLDQMGYKTGVDLQKLSEIVDYCADQLKAPLGGRMTAWLAKEK